MEIITKEEFLSEQEKKYHAPTEEQIDAYLNHQLEIPKIHVPFMMRYIENAIRYFVDKSQQLNEKIKQNYEVQKSEDNLQAETKNP